MNLNESGAWIYFMLRSKGGFYTKGWESVGEDRILTPPETVFASVSSESILFILD